MACAHVVEGLRRQGEHDGGRLGLGEDRDRALIAGMNDVAGVDHAHAHAAVVGRHDIGVVEIGLRGFDGRDVGVDRGLGLIDLGLLQIEVLLGLGVLQDQRLVAGEILLPRRPSAASSCALRALA